MNRTAYELLGRATWIVGRRQAKRKVASLKSGDQPKRKIASLTSNRRKTGFVVASVLTFAIAALALRTRASH